MKIRKNQGFTLVEMLVVIAIIAILAAALFPAINSAMQSARATAMKQSGRGIWIAVSTASNEREILYLTPLWPYDMNIEAAGGDKNLEITTVAQYFNYLLSNGVDSRSTAADKYGPAKTPDEQVCPDLNPNSFTANGVNPGLARTELAEENIAWSVVEVGGPGKGQDDAFFVSRNLDLKDTYTRIQQPPSGKITGPKAEWKDIKPFGRSRAVWITLGGGTLDARNTYMTDDRLFAPETLETPVPVKCFPNTTTE